MIPNLMWSVTGGVYRPGCVVNAKVDLSSLRDLEPVLLGVWSKADEIFRLFTRDREDASIARIQIEIWIDSGRIIYLLARKREIARLILSIPLLEQTYFALPDDDLKFDQEYGCILEQVMQALTRSLRDAEAHTVIATAKQGRLRITVRDSDDKSTERLLMD